MSDVTRLLEAAQAGDRQAAADLLPLVYDELRKLAAARMAAEAPGPHPRTCHSPWSTKRTSDSSATSSFRTERGLLLLPPLPRPCGGILVDHARHRNRLKRGSGRHRVDLDRLTDLVAATDEDLVELDDALERLRKEYPSAAELVTLRFFAGMTLGEAADNLGLPRRTADRYWGFARAWLADALAEG